ncbi:MAG TPA: zinc ribbon domain-containing protein, partial [Vicinamibacterales bacterium]|nr:zinc ribbon domain-containing protein [Vicinamibacterales bacterium]
MYCPRCGAQIDSSAAFCGSCGAATAAAPPVVVDVSLKRPGIVTVLAILQFLGGAIWLLIGLLIVATVTSTGAQAAIGGLVV